MAFPKHPMDMILPGIREIDVYNYYEGVKGKMLEELKGRNIFIGIIPKEYKPGSKPVYVRHPYDKAADYITINSEKDFEIYHTGRTLEVHITMPQAAPYYVVDYDAGDEPFSKTKFIVGEIADKLKALPEVKDIEIRYTGKRGFHVIADLKKSRDVDEARTFLHGWLKKNFSNRDDVVFGESPSGGKGALGLTCMKLNGGQIAKWSLRPSGRCCVDVPRANLASFQKEDADMEKAYKKATGKTFVFQKEQATRIVKAFMDGPDTRSDKDIPKKPIKEIPHMQIELPVVNAVKALMSEKPVSSGWHTGFQKSFNNLPPRWAIVFQGSLSYKGREAAKLAGLDIQYRNNLTDVSLPGVKKEELQEATRVFNKFAQEYLKLSSKVASIISGSLGGEVMIVASGYDNEIFQAGYKGKFIIGEHHAEKAGPHWDVRFEWPVKSLQKALKTYQNKGRGQDEPMEKAYPDKSGTVYRSFVDKKRILPSADKKVFLVESEDHPINYEFEGTISEGYGKGTVKIHDKGTYELLDKTKGRLLIRMTGKKVNGTFALVPYQGNFLWVKVNDAKAAK